MKIAGISALVTGGASGLGAATVRALAGRGARVTIADVDGEHGAALAEELGDVAQFVTCDVTDSEQVASAVAAAGEHDPLRLAVGCAGIGLAERMVGRGGAADPASFERVVAVNLVGMYNLLRLSADAMTGSEPLESQERGVVVMTASIAAFDGQIGQTAYAASKGGVAALTLPAARELSSRGVRVVTIAPGLFDTPLLAGLPEPARAALGESVPFPSRLGDPSEFATLACSIAENAMLNGETIRLDGGLRMGMR
jgi:NAD(P)-dependent dehydrogenase (short-subunit alcohol dehydrogenase family)